MIENGTWQISWKWLLIDEKLCPLVKKYMHVGIFSTLRTTSIQPRILV